MVIFNDFSCILSIDEPRCVLDAGLLEPPFLDEHGNRNQRIAAREQPDLLEQNIVEEDPLVLLGPDIVAQILSYLEPHHLVQCMWVSRAWRRLARDDALWARHCEGLWHSKLSIPEIALADGHIPRVQAFSLSLFDSRRELVTVADLCRCTWDFRFRWNATGNYRIAIDPMWRALPPMERIFNADGSISPGRNDRLFGEHENRWEILYEAGLDGRLVRTLVRVNHWPPLEVRRTASWGWELENRWVVYRSKALPI